MEVEKDHNYITSLGTVLHNCVDALRYLVIARVMAAQVEVIEEEADSDGLMDYDSYMTGGVISHSYMGV